MNIGSIVNGVYNTVAFFKVVSVVWVCINVVSDRFSRGMRSSEWQGAGMRSVHISV